jgi:hypothetical protein
MKGKNYEKFINLLWILGVDFSLLVALPRIARDRLKQQIKMSNTSVFNNYINSLKKESEIYYEI